MTPPPPYDGRHLIADLHGCAASLDDTDTLAAVLRAGAAAAGATVLDVRLHHFGRGAGVTGVALLAESHISIHSWPEHGYAALDIFLCGTRADPQAALAVIVAALRPVTVDETILRRGYGAAPRRETKAPASPRLAPPATRAYAAPAPSEEPPR